jgi:putative nucleotidyltransferase with HDIG domain
LAEQFIPIPVATLLAHTIPDFALYLAKPDYGERYVLYRREGLYLAPEHLRRLRVNGVNKVYIAAKDRPLQQRYMVASARQLLGDPRRPSREKAEAVYEFSKSAVQCALEEPCEDNIRTCRELAQEQVRYVVSDPQALPNLLRIISHDYYTYTHSVNVCSFTVALCRQVGLTNVNQLKLIGIGAMLHDIGKNRIDRDILNKPGRLTPAERVLIKKHPEHGVAVLAETSPVPPEAVEIVLSHHEKCDGSGYPRGLSGEALSIPVRACCIADIFDALTTHRSYKSAYAGFRALQIMQQDMRLQLDQQLLAELIRLVGQASQVAARQAA